MTRTDNIYNIPSGHSFADALARYIYDCAKGDPLILSDYLVLLPSRRSCRTLRDAFLRLTEGKPTTLPNLRPLGEADAEELSILLSTEGDDNLDISPAIPSLKRQIILAETIISLYDKILPEQQRPRFDQATQLAAELARFLDQVQTENINFDRLNTLVPDKFSDHWKITLEFLKILTEHWPNILASHHAIDPAARRNLLLDAQAKIWRNQPPQTPVIAAGSIASIPAARDLLQIIHGLPNGEIILPGLDTDLDNESWDLIAPDHPQHFLKTLLDHLEAPRSAVRVLPNLKTNSPETGRFWSEVMRPAETSQNWRNLQDNPLSVEITKSLNLIECKTSQEEAEVISLLLRQAIENPDKTAAVVTADRNLALRITNSMKRWGITLDDLAGTSLHLTAKGSWSLNCLTMIIDNFAPVSLLSALRHPLPAFANIYGHETLNLIESKVLRGAQTDYGLNYLTQTLTTLSTDEKHPFDAQQALDGLHYLGEITQNMANLAQNDANMHPFRVYLTAHLEMLEALATTQTEDGKTRIWQGEDGEALGIFFTEIMGLAKDLPNVNLEQYRLILKQLMSQKTVRPKHGMHPRISILGQIEARLFVADTVILAGLNEGVWPSDTAADPWMSRQMRQDFGLPAHEQTIGIAAHDFVQLASAPNVIITRALLSGGAPSVPSRWLLRLETVLAAMDMSLSSKTAQQYLSWRRHLDEPKAITPMLRPAPRPPVSARPNKLSVTGVERLMRDPYEVYAKYILRLRKLDPLDDDPDASEKGQLLHKILERFVRQYPDKMPDNAEGELIKMGRRAFDELNIPEDIESFWWPRFLRLAAKYIEAETQWRETASPLKTETKGELNLNDDKFAFELTAIADRIDRLNDGKLAIIDYKTGTIPTNKDIENGFSPQMWLEALIASRGGFKDIEGAQSIGYLGFWKVSGGHPPMKLHQIKSDDHSAEINTTEDGLRRILECFADPNTPYYARPNDNFVPTYSDYRHLERVQEWIFEQNIQDDITGEDAA